MRMLLQSSSSLLLSVVVVVVFVDFCSSVQIIPIDYINNVVNNYNYQSNLRDIGTSSNVNVNVFYNNNDNDNDKLHHSSPITNQEIIQYFTIIDKFNNDKQLLFICRYFLNQEHFLNSNYLHELMTIKNVDITTNDTQSSGGDGGGDGGNHISNDNVFHVYANPKKMFPTSNAKTRVNENSNTIIRFNETNSTFFIIINSNVNNLSDFIELIEVDFQNYNYLSFNHNVSKLINSNSINNVNINDKFNPLNNRVNSFGLSNKNAIPLSGCLKMKNSTSFSITILKAKGKSGQLLSTPLNFFIGGNFLLLLGINIDLGLNGINLSKYHSHTITCRGGNGDGSDGGSGDGNVTSASRIEFDNKLINTKSERIEGEIIQILQPINKNIISLPKSKYRLIKIEPNISYQQQISFIGFKKFHKYISYKKNKSKVGNVGNNVKYEFNYITTPWKKLFTNGFKQDLGIILFLDDNDNDDDDDNNIKNNVPYCESRPEYLQCNVF
ncbi:conserved hypothetical protein [Candida dubliniensis CD36]|uniref:Uncharacterized protein n=1 Tax=Candida dubliniensis (strain CD36 / ATCC MYA-646 / CBS 7987 / NCPF 3949 / NRRL Y-17841) TaxID=573826 RepID=B9W9J5_CANDC|nr:conserved hypothetical protein [Candida dubliniensis CD36]CAX45478.1 conserved hypothetical protein [Candida dubliniensis CD36]